MGWAAEDDYEATYGKEQAKIRRRLKNKLMGEATMGTKAGEWSARKSQELKRRYEAACERKGLKPYKGSKTSKQKDLSAWSKQGWRTASGRKSSVTGEPYFPAKAVQALKERELYAKAKRQKAAATRAGKQRATYSKDIQAVVARYRAEDHTIDDLDEQTLINRMEHIGERMDEIVRKHGGSYEKAESDPTYLRLASQHNSLARAYARKQGFDAEDFVITEPPMDIEEEAQARLEAIRQLQWGLRVIERMLRDGNIDDAIAFTRATVDAMDQEEAADRDLGLDPDRFSAESDDEFEFPHHDRDWLYDQHVRLRRSAKMIADMIGVSTIQVTAKIHEFGIRGDATRGVKPKAGFRHDKQHRIDVAQDLSDKGHTDEEIAEIMGIRVSTVRNYREQWLLAGSKRRAEDDPSFTPDPDLPLTEQARDEYTFMMPDGSTLWIHNQDWAVRMADMKPIWDLKQLSEYGGTPTTITYMSLGAVDPADYTDFIPEWRPGMSFPPEDMVNQWIDPCRLGEAHNEFTKQYETNFWPGLSLREILGKYDFWGKPVFDAESDDEFEYPHHDPDWLYEHHIVQGLSARKIAEMLDVPVNLITRRIHEFGLYVPGEYTADRRLSKNELRRMRERRAEDDPTSTAVYIGPGNHLSVVDFIDSDHFVLIDSQPRTEYRGGEHEMEPWMQHYFMDQLMDMAKALDYELVDNQSRLNDQNASRMTFRTPSGQTIDYYYNCVYPFAEGQEIPEVMKSLSTADRLIIAGYHPVEQLLDDMPSLDQVYLYVNTHYPTEEGDHSDDLGNPTVIKGFFERDDLRFTIMGLDEDYESGDITDQYMEQGSLGEYGSYPEAARQIESNYWLAHHYDSEDNPVSRIAAGTNDVLADFANAHDTDDGFYFAGGLIGGLAIAVAGNIIANHVQRWIDARRSGSS